MTLLRDAQIPTTSIDPPQDEKASTSRSGRYALGLGTKLGIAAGSIAFGVACFMIAVGGGDPTSSGESSGVVTAAASVAADSSVAVIQDAEVSTDSAPESSSSTDSAAAAEAAPVDAADTAPTSPSDLDVPVLAESAPVDEASESVPASSTDTDESAPASSTDTDESAVDDAPADEQPLTRIAQLPEGMDSPAGPPGAPERYSIQSNGVLFLRGTLPDIETETAIVRAVEAVMGPGNAISEYTIDPDVFFDPDADSPVYTDEKVLFEPASAVIEPAFFQVIAPLPFLLQIQPNVVITINGHTDSVGNAADNLVLSQQRVDAVRDWVISQGGDGERVIAVGLGETEPIADNSTEEGRTLNRRVETVISGFDFTIDG